MLSWGVAESSLHLKTLPLAPSGEPSSRAETSDADAAIIGARMKATAAGRE